MLGYTFKHFLYLKKINIETRWKGDGYFLSYVADEELINSCTECKDTCQYYLDITLPYEYKYKYLQEDITSIFPSLLHINTGVISYELCRPKDIDQ